MLRPPSGPGSDHSRQTREWADRVAAEAPAYYLEVLADYRDRVAEFHSDTADSWPDVFPLLAPTRIGVICTQPAIWTFATASTDGADEVIVEQQWEHPTLATPDIWMLPDPEARIRAHATFPGTEADWRLISKIDFRSSMIFPDESLFAERRKPGFYIEGWDLADGDLTLLHLTDMVNGISGKAIDRTGLRAVKQRFPDVEQIADRNKRGRAFEVWVNDLFVAHGCNAELGKHVPGEQVDIFVHRPFRAVVECRWRSGSVGRDAVDMLVGKLRRERPATVIGMSVSMSGFTSEATDEVRRVANDRTILLLDANDIADLADGRVHIAELVDSRLDEIVRRYPALPGSG